MRNNSVPLDRKIYPDYLNASKEIAAASAGTPLVLNTCNVLDF